MPQKTATNPGTSAPTAPDPREKLNQIFGACSDNGLHGPMMGIGEHVKKLTPEQTNAILNRIWTVVAPPVESETPATRTAGGSTGGGGNS